MEATETHLFDMVQDSLAVSSFLGKTGVSEAKQPKILERVSSWFDSLDVNQKLQVLRTEDQIWIQTLMKMYHKEAAAKEKGVFIFNMSEVRTKVSNQLGAKLLQDYPRLTTKTSYRFVPWSRVRANKKKEDSQERHKRYDGNKMGAKLVAGLRLVPLLDKRERVSSDSRFDKQRWTVSLEPKLAAKNAGSLYRVLEEAKKECCTREFYLQVEKRPREPRNRPQQALSIENSKERSLVADTQNRYPAKEKPSNLTCMMQRGRLSAFSLGAFVSHRVQLQLKQAYQKWSSRQLTPSLSDSSSFQMISRFWRTCDPEEKSKLLSSLAGNGTLASGMKADISASLSAGLRFRLEQTSRDDLLVAALGLLQVVEKRQSELALAALLDDDDLSEVVVKKKKKKKKKKKTKKPKKRPQAGKLDKTTAARAQSEVKTASDTAEIRSEQLNARPRDKKKVSKRSQSPRMSKKKRRNMARDIIDLICSKAVHQVHKKQKKAAYKVASRRRFTNGIVMSMVNRAAGLVAKREQRTLKASKRGSEACRQRRKQAIEEFRAMRKRRGQRLFQAPAERLDTEAFILTPHCVNGKPQMRQLREQPKSCTSSCWWWGGRFQVDVIGGDSERHSSSTSTVTMHCRFGQMCQRHDCPYPHDDEQQHANLSPFHPPQNSQFDHQYVTKRKVEMKPQTIESSSTQVSRIVLNEKAWRHIQAFLSRRDRKSLPAVCKEWWRSGKVLAVDTASKMPPPTVDHLSLFHKRVQSVETPWRPSIHNAHMLRHSMGKYLSSCHSLLRSFGGDASMCTILTNDIQQMARLLNQVSAQRLPAQRAIINALRTSLSKLWPTARAEVYGSLATGLCTPSSDVDIVICDTEHVPKDIQKAQESRVQRLSKHLSREKWIRTVNTIGSASMPIVKVIAMAGATEVQLDLSFDSSLHRGLPTCAYVRGLCIEYPELVPLSLVLKQFLVSKKINNPYSGGLSSYGLILMLASIVKRDYIFQQFTSSSLLGTKETKSETTPRQSSPQNRSAPDVDTKGNEENECDATIGDLVPYIKTGLFSDKANLGRLLLTFFDTYGRRFDPELHALSVSNSEDVPDFAFCGAKYRHWFPNHTVVIIDPFNPNNNIGRTCFNFWQIQQVFSTALNCAIDRFVSIPIRRLRQSVLGAVFSTSHHKIVVDTERKRNLPRAFTPSPPRAKAGSRGTRAASLHLHEDGDAIHTEPLQSVDDNLVECRLTMQRKKAVLVANIEELNKQIKKRKLMNELLIVKAEQRSKTVGQLAKNGDVDNLMSHVQELTSYLAWLNEQKRANHKEIEHLKTKIQSLKQDFHADMKALASGVGKAPFTIEQLQVVFQGESKARLKRSGRRERKRVDAIVDRTTCIASWRIAQLKEDIEEMEQMNDQLEACAQYQAAKLAMQKLKARAGGDADGAVKLASEAPLNMIKLLNSRTSSRASTEGAARSDSKRGTTRQASRCNDVNIERKKSKTTHALEWCPDATVTGGADEQEVRRTSTYLAWLNEQNRVNQMQIKHLKAKVDREKQQYICEIARLTIEAVTMTPTLSQASSPQETPKGGSFGRG